MSTPDKKRNLNEKAEILENQILMEKNQYCGKKADLSNFKLDNISHRGLVYQKKKMRYGIYIFWYHNIIQFKRLHNI